MDLRQLRQLVTIAELGSYRRAAEVLHIAQPALSVSIQKLEHLVGVQLLERGTRGVTLTAAGEALVTDARRALYHADQARQAARRVGLGEWGTLRLGFVGSATYTLLPRLLPAFRGACPDVGLELREDSTVGLLAMLRSGEIDAALVRGPAADDPLLASWALERDDLILAVPRGHPLALLESAPLCAARGEAFVVYSPKMVPGLYGVTQELCRSAGFTPRIGQEAIQVQTVVSLVASGMGVALVPGVARVYSTPHVVFVPLTDARAHSALALSLVTHREGANAAVLKLRDCLEPCVPTAVAA
ncbi:LysR family transcriptional regulator [Bordetella sp. N]|uniref:LysR family transcriptional regulator n=1 Tax=Bordetella sp. N TaxID=1746199 RepID=UPI00070F396D|nr:LysR family transcriptional regulator [Bordetella sp. N]ALM86676.1 LysR family transcriptional regulator [Bordetella sp. N]